MTDTFIGIDLGTSGCRACLIDANEQILKQSRAPFPEPAINGPCVEQDASIWWHAVQQVLAELLTHPLASSLKTISVDGTSSTVLITDENYQPLAPALMYNDSRASQQAERIEQMAPASTSAVYGSSSSLSKSLWLINKFPAGKHVLHQADYISGKLSGSYASDSNNCLKLGFDPVSEQWPSWLAESGFPTSILPAVNPPGVIAGELTEQLTQTFKTPENVKIISGTTDSIAGFLATGANQLGDAVVSIGSTIAIKVLNDKPVNSANEGIYSHKINNMWLVGGASNAGTTVLRNLFSEQQLQSLTERLHFENPTELNYYPIPKPGERFPVCNPGQQAVLNPRPTNNAVFLQAILESLTRIEKQCYQVLEDKGINKINRLFTTGGAVINTRWMKYRETQLSYQMQQPAQTEACFGTALLAKQGYYHLTHSANK